MDNFCHLKGHALVGVFFGHSSREQQSNGQFRAPFLHYAAAKPITIRVPSSTKISSYKEKDSEIVIVAMVYEFHVSKDLEGTTRFHITKQNSKVNYVCNTSVSKGKLFLNCSRYVFASLSSGTMIFSMGVVLECSCSFRAFENDLYYAVAAGVFLSEVVLHQLSGGGKM